MRQNCYDVLKAVCIIAVVLYHVGLCKFGYLGVDIFFVLAGYFTTKSLTGQSFSGTAYVRFLGNRLFRLLPLLLIACISVLAFGWWFMMPDDYENAAQSAIATCFFGNNMLQAITVKDYWAVANEFKPLMHTWYAGTLMQFYAVWPLLIWFIAFLVKKPRRSQSLLLYLLAAVGLCSFALWVATPDEAARFYYLPYRLWEFCAGAAVFYFFEKKQATPSPAHRYVGGALIFAYAILLALMFCDAEWLGGHLRQPLAVVLSASLLFLLPRTPLAQANVLSNELLARIGAASFSIYVWHQVVFAVTRYSFASDLLVLKPFVAVLSVTFLLSFLSYRYVERVRASRRMWSAVSVTFVVVCAFSLCIYVRAGVVRDVPELEVRCADAHRGMWSEYCDRGYRYDKDFAAVGAGKPRWYVIGNSFGRDFLNIIDESPIADSIEVVYSDMETYDLRPQRFAKADVVFLSSLLLDEDGVSEVRSLCRPGTKLFIIGEKNFGESNGQVYRHRFSPSYHSLAVPLAAGYAERNAYLKSLYPDIFIDLIAMATLPDGRVRVFTDEGLLISHDCRHLTRAGARFYAERIDWTRFFNNDCDR